MSITLEAYEVARLTSGAACVSSDVTSDVDDAGCAVLGLLRLGKAYEVPPTFGGSTACRTVSAPCMDGIGPVTRCRAPSALGGSKRGNSGLASAPKEEEDVVNAFESTVG